MFDVIQQIGSSFIQYGHFNKRIYIMKICEKDLSDVFARIETILKANKFSKIFAKIPATLELYFLKKGFEVEARIPDFYNNQTEVLFISKYLDTQRRIITTEKSALIKNIIVMSNKKSQEVCPVDLPENFYIRKLSEKDTLDLAQLYKKVFQSYPFPIFNSDYLCATMKKNIIYFGIFNQNDDVVSASSAEMDISSDNVEMTDFATLPDYRGFSFALMLLIKMEEEMRKKNITTFYTIARAYSYGMNITFARNGYTFCGTLYNNTNISGKIESMNVWHKFRTIEVSKEDEHALY